jgi:predicted DNA-binding transcriptional regulator AlpA
MNVKPRLVRACQLYSTPKKQGLLPVSHTTLWRWIKSGKFPTPMKIGGNMVVWDSEVVEHFVQTGEVR